MSTESNALATASGPSAVAKQPRTIKDLLQGAELRNAVQAALPRHLKADRFIRVALNATMRQPELLECSRESFFRALLDLSALGIEADGRRAHLIPFRNNKTRTMDVQLIIDYKGIAELVRRSGDVSYIHADAVYANDDFAYAYGSGAFLKHVPNMEERGDKAVAFYSFVRLKDGTEDFIVMSRREVDKIRARSKAKDAGPWVSDYDEMGKKTVFRRHSKWLPLSPDVRDVVEKDDELVNVDGALATAIAERGAVTIDSFSASADSNRGHEAAAADRPADPKRDVALSGLMLAAAEMGQDAFIRWLAEDNGMEMGDLDSATTAALEDLLKKIEAK
jgi:recombination protein RecT